MAVSLNLKPLPVAASTGSVHPTPSLSERETAISSGAWLPFAAPVANDARFA
jgi:hypothetical protein